MDGDKLVAIILSGIVIIVPFAITVALDESSYRKKAIICIAGGTVIGAIGLAFLGTLIGLMLPGTPGSQLGAEWLRKSIFIGVGFGGGVGAAVGLLGGTMIFGLSILIRYVFLRAK